jgi:alpha-beta hydrolase superfamily lysophospholipase
MRILLIVLITSIVMFFIGWFSYAYVHKVSPREATTDIKEVVAKPLEKYSIENMQKASWQSGAFKIEKQIADEKEYTSYLFTFTFNPEIEGNKKAKTTGQINIPKGDGPFPVILMFRGYVDQTMYSTGTGTRPAGAYFAKNGFITIAPDFLGYAGSDTEAGNVFESRFQTYTTAISLLKTIEKWKDMQQIVQVNNDLKDSKLITNDLMTYSSINLWAHSNGGQIALTTLAVTGANYPTTLWAPASKSFPYVVLYFTDESEDEGKFIRKELSKFEDVYDVDKYSYTNYLDNIKAPIQLHQGTADAAVPIAWSNELVGKLRAKDKDIIYFTYQGADHNLRPSWDEVVEKDVEFFKKHE